MAEAAAAALQTSDPGAGSPPPGSTEQRSTEQPGNDIPQDTQDTESPDESGSTGDPSDPDLIAAFEQQDEAASRKPERQKPEAARKPADPQEKKTDTQDPAKAKTKDEQDTEALLKDERLPAGFRKRLGQVNSELQQARSELERARQEAEQAKSEGGGNTKVLAKQIEERDSRIKELEATIGTLKFESSQDYKSKFEKPFMDAAEDAKEIIESLEVIDTDADGMQVTRPATWDGDFAEIYNIAKAGKLGLAYKLIDQKFGGAAAEVKTHLSALRRLGVQAEKALKSERDTWQSRQETARAEEAAKQARADELWTKIGQDIKAKRPEWYSEVKDDAEGNKLLKEGFDLVNRYFSSRAKLSMEDNMILEAQIAHRAAALPRMAAQVTALKAEIEDLKATIKSFEDSGPGGGRRDDGGRRGGSDDGFFNDAELAGTFTQD